MRASRRLLLEHPLVGPDKVLRRLAKDGASAILDSAPGVFVTRSRQTGNGVFGARHGSRRSRDPVRRHEVCRTRRWREVDSKFQYGGTVHPLSPFLCRPIARGGSAASPFFGPPSRPASKARGIWTPGVHLRQEFAASP